MGNNNIFVQIASYRDRELLPTIKHCLSKAKFPENLTFSIVWQHSIGDGWDTLDEFKNDVRFKIIDINHTESKGACWARNLAQKQWYGEKFSLQIDSHMRFVENWDDKVIKIWESLEDDKALITGYPPNYIPDAPEDQWYKIPQICNVYRFDYKYPLSRPMNMDGWEDKESPVKGVHVSAGFIFGPGEINETVPYDPDFYFSGEETAMAIRYFTNGYNIYNSHRVIVHHFYQRLDHPKHWGDNQDWSKYNRVAHERLDCLLERNNDYDLGVYGLGIKRTLNDFIKYSGIDFVNCIVHKDTELGKDAPCSNSEEGWDNEQDVFDSIISWDFKKIEKVEDVRFWAMIVLDQHGIAIHREDLIYNENKDIIDGKVVSKKFNFVRSKNKQIPTQLLIWPFSNKLEWGQPSYFKI